MDSRLLTTPDRATVRRIGIVLLVALLVVGAGCIGGDGGGGGDDGNATTADTGAAAADTGTNTGTSTGSTGGSGGDSGGSGTGGDGDPATGTVSLLDHVPAEQSLVMSIDMAVTQDPTTQQLLQAGQEQPAAPGGDVQDSLAVIEAQTGLDPTAVENVMVFGQTGGLQTSVNQPTDSAESVGILANTGWSSDDLISAMQSSGEGSLVEETYSESGVFYRLEGSADTPTEGPTYLGVLGDGAYVLGDEGAVRGSLDIRYGNGEAMSGALRTAYQNTRDGYFTMAMTVPESSGTGAGQPGMGQMGDIDAITAVYYTSGDTVGVEARLMTPDASSAQQFSSAMSFLLASYSQEQPELAPVIENLETGQDGSDVTFTYEQNVDDLIAMLEQQSGGAP